MNVDIRSARADDAPFLAWVMLTATRSHNKYGAWEHYVGGTEEDCLFFFVLLRQHKGLIYFIIPLLFVKL
jgi:hypothetical protein